MSVPRPEEILSNYHSRLLVLVENEYHLMINVSTLVDRSVKPRHEQRDPKRDNI